MIRIFIPDVTRIPNELVKRVSRPLLKSRGLVFCKLWIYSSCVVYFDKSILMGVSMHSSISSVEYFPFPLQLENLRRVNICAHLVVVSIKPGLVIFFPSGSVSHHCADLSRSASESSIKRRLVLFRKSSYIRCIKPITILRSGWWLLNLRRGRRGRSCSDWSNIFRLFVKVTIVGTSHEFCPSHISPVISPTRE